MNLRELLPYAFYAVLVLVALWDVFLAGQISQLRRVEFGSRCVSCVDRNWTSSNWLASLTKASDTHALSRSGKRNRGEVLVGDL